MASKVSLRSDSGAIIKPSPFIDGAVTTSKVIYEPRSRHIDSAGDSAQKAAEQQASREMQLSSLGIGTRFSKEA